MKPKGTPQSHQWFCVVCTLTYIFYVEGMGTLCSETVNVVMFVV
jgi:hypothetical protein